MTQTTDFEERVRKTLDKLAKGHFIQWDDKTYTKIDAPTITALQKLWFGDKHAGI